jgi:NhaP-type Na+/H+ or K+/H+ antiporter
MAGVIAMLVILAGWSLVAGRLARWNVTPAIAVVAAGIVLTAGSDPAISVDVDNHIAERVVEVALALVLFVDATESPGGLLGNEPRITLRLLMIALPLSLLLAWGLGFTLLPDQDIWVLALVAIVAVPTDLAPAVTLVRDRRVPARLRGLLNVESGLNDGVIAPLFLFCVAGAMAPEHGSPVLDALGHAVPAVLLALGVGAGVGTLGARGLTRAWGRGWTQPAALRLGVLALPLLAYTLAVAVEGNGFVAAFVAGVCFSSSARRLPSDALQLVEDTGTLVSLAVWFVFGQVVNQALVSGLSLSIIVFALLALTVVRMLPVALSLVRTDIRGRDALFLGWMGPRGLASIVFGTLAYIELEGEASVVVVKAMVVTVLASVVLHGLSAGPIAAAYGRARTAPLSRGSSGRAG